MPPQSETVPEHALSAVATARELKQEYTGKLARKVASHLIRSFLIPRYIRIAILTVKAAGYIWKALTCLSKGRLEVPVLDATAITVSILRRDFKTAGSVMFLLQIGEILEDWTHKKSISDLAGSMSLNVEKVWMKTEGQPVLLHTRDVNPGDEIIVNAGSMIPFDGTVSSGEAMVNQSTLTGEGGFAPNLSSDEETIETILEAVKLAGYASGKDFMIAMDAASSEWKSEKGKKNWAVPRSIPA